MRFLGIIASLLLFTTSYGAHHFEGVKQVSVQGKIKLILGTGGKSSRNVVPKSVNVEKVGTTVVFSTDSNKLQVVKLYNKDKFRELQTLNVMEQSQLIAKHIHAHQLDINSETSGSIMLNGVVGIRKISHSGTGTVEAYWLDSKQIQISASSGKLILGGVVPQLYISAAGDSAIDASGLTAKYAWIKSEGTSYSKVRVSDVISVMGKNQGLVENYRSSAYINELSHGESALITVG